MMIFNVPRETSWFELTARENFERFLLPAQPEGCLQLGCFTGDASLWLLQNTPCVLIDVDTFEGSDEHEGYDFDEVRSTYYSRMEPFMWERLGLHTIRTQDFLIDRARQYWNRFDFIYVDADHHAKEVLRDAVMAWPLLKKGGLMAFDDYEWGQGMPALDTPRPGIDAFLTVYSPEIVVKNAQCWVRKG